MYALRSLLLVCLAALALAADFKGWPDSNLEEETTNCLSTGWRRYNQLKTSIKKPHTDKSATDVCANPELKVTGQNTANIAASDVAARFASFISAADLGISSSDKNFRHIEVLQPATGTPGDDGTAFYEQSYSPKDGAIAVTDIVRKGKDLLQYSDVTWSVWTKLISDARDSSIKPGNLKMLVHYSCVNPNAKAVAVDIFGVDPDEDSDVVYTFAPKDGETEQSAQQNPYYALLGLDNGTGAKNILLDYQDALGYKMLSSIVAWREKGDQEIMGVAYMLS